MSKNSQKIYRGVGVKIKLSESSQDSTRATPQELQLFKVGTYYHETYGKIDITSDILKKMAINFAEKVRGIDLALDYKHDSEGEAAAWFEDVYTKENDTELWFKPRWTSKGKDVVLSEEYKYISPDFTLSYTDNESLKNYGPVIMGAGLTNRPFIKRMTPIILSEEYKMNELEEAKKKIEMLEAEIAKLKGAPAPADKTAEMAEKEKAALAEKDKQLSEKDKEIAALKEEKIASEKKSQFEIMLSEGKAVPAQREAWMKGDMTEFVKNHGNLNFSEKGSNKVSKDDVNTGDAEDKIIKLTEEKLSKNKDMDYGVAMSMVLSENPDLNKQYKKKFN